MTNWEEKIKEREFIDLLSAKPHPVAGMDDAGYTYYDYVVYKIKKHNGMPKTVSSELEHILAGGLPANKSSRWRERESRL